MNDTSILRPLIMPDSVKCGFTTRNGGVSKPPFDSLNFGRKTTDDPAAVDENFRLFFQFLDVDTSKAAFMGQVHSDTVRIVDNGGLIPATDGLITVEPGLVIAVKTADCVPLLLFDPATKTAAAVHCGWRSLCAGIAEKTASLMETSFGAKPGDILAAIGPSAGVCCYEIGDDVSRHLQFDSVRRENGAMYADLRHELRRRLEALGLRSDHVETSSDCTICNSGRFYSHRRDGVQSGRMMGFIKIQ